MTIVILVYEEGLKSCSAVFSMSGSGLCLGRRVEEGSFCGAVGDV